MVLKRILFKAKSKEIGAEADPHSLYRPNKKSHTNVNVRQHPEYRE